MEALFLERPPYRLRIYGTGQEPRPVIWVHSHDADALAQRLEGRCALICVEKEDGLPDLSPWPAPALFRGEAGFTGGAPEHLTALEALLPEAEALLGFPVLRRGIAGYSLAGLFAVYALYHSPLFQDAASVSGSLWYDGWEDYALSHPLMAEQPRIYLSLGSQDHRTRNRRMAAVKGATQRLAAHWAALCPTRLEQNPGGHFDDPLGRLARGIAALAEPSWS